MNKRNIFLLCTIGFLQGMVFYAPVATLYRQAAGLGIFQITLMESVSLALSILLEIPWGIAADRIGYRKTMLICCSLFFVSKIVFWQANGFAGFLMERMILAVVCSGLSGVDTAMLYESCGQRDSHRFFGVYEYLQQAGLLLAAAVCSLWIGTDFRLAGFLTVLSYGMAAALACFLQEEKLSNKRIVTAKQSMTVLKEQLQNRKLLLFLISVALVTETHQTITVFLNQLQYTRAGMTVDMISAAYLLLSLAGLASMFSAGLSEKMGEKQLAIALISGSILCCCMLAITKNAVLSVTAVIGLRICYAVYQPLQIEQQNHQIQTHYRATALSMNAALVSSIAVFVNLVYGSVAERSLPCTMLLGAGFCLTALLFYRRSC